MVANQSQFDSALNNSSFSPTEAQDAVFPAISVSGSTVSSVVMNLIKSGVAQNADDSVLPLQQVRALTWEPDNSGQYNDAVSGLSVNDMLAVASVATPVVAVSGLGDVLIAHPRGSDYDYDYDYDYGAEERAFYFPFGNSETGPLVKSAEIDALLKEADDRFLNETDDWLRHINSQSLPLAEQGLVSLDANGLDVTAELRQLTVALQSTPVEATSALPVNELLSVAGVVLPSVVAASLDALIAGMLPERSDYETLQQQLEFNPLVA